MICHRHLRLLFASLALIALCFWPCFSQPQPSPDSSSASPSTDMGQEASSPDLTLPELPLPAPSDMNGRLSTDSDLLNSTADRYDKLWEGLKSFLQAAGISETLSDGSLETSIQSVQDSIRSGAQAQADLRTAQTLAFRKGLENSLWRVTALSGVLGLGFSLASPLVGQQPLPEAGIGLAVGGAAGIVWGVIDWIASHRIVPGGP